MKSKKSNVASRLTCEDRHTTTFPLDSNDALSRSGLRPTPHGDGLGRDGVARRAASQVSRPRCLPLSSDVRGKGRERSGASIVVYLNFELMAVQDDVVACCRKLERTIG